MSVGGAVGERNLQDDRPRGTDAGNPPEGDRIFVGQGGRAHDPVELARVGIADRSDSPVADVDDKRADGIGPGEPQPASGSARWPL